MTHQQTRSIIVRASVPTVFGAWARFEDFPRMSPHVVSVEPAGEGRTHWVIKGPFGTQLEWDALLTRFEKNKRIAWNSTLESPVRCSGQVTFTELGPGETQLTVVIQYATTDGAAQASDPMLGDAGAQLEEDLRRFKAHVEGRPAPQVATAGASHAGGGG